MYPSAEYTTPLPSPVDELLPPKKLLTEVVVLIPITLGVTLSATASTTDSAVSSTFILTLLPDTPELLVSGVLSLLLLVSFTAVTPLTAPITAASRQATATVAPP